ncbi:ubiquinone biosynthesis protein COQ9, mitochondrial [Drosophila guanche]|uniref:Ubiquinone biosynthesis protein n=1 Tax=Drosophila guanche TaxID=7266 RepID=A0A3B0JPB6_DROGU|nr:ubiquinone biosynthesis protein COQ9, mitochondrial [Drosophila guanche]SPP75449.1 blast:Tyrosine-protein kinase receptor torso [Drosophila guanche]
MASVRCLEKLFRLQKLLLPLHAQSCRLHRQLPLAAASLARGYAKDATEKSTANGSLEDFRAREEQLERERDAAEEAAAKATQNETGQGAGGNQQESGEQSAKQAKVDAIREQILDAALEHVPQHGWTRQSIVLGAEQCGYPSVVHGMFPEGGFALVSHFNGKCNAQLVQSLKQKTGSGQQEVENPLDFLVQAVRQRMEMIAPYKAQWPQAMSLIAQPQHASTALAQVLTLVDDICYYSGDRSVDFGWYTRRIGLATIMKMTELYLLQDTSAGHTQTWDFLKNRMDEAVQLQMALSQTEGMTHTFQRSFNSAFITARNILGLGFKRT